MPSKDSTKGAPVVHDVEPASALAGRRAARRAGTGRRSDERWEQIERAATIVFRRMGYANATLEDVAAEVGMNRATLYYYVRDKAELLIEILGDPNFRMTDDLEAIRCLDLPVIERLRLAIEQHMKALEDNYPNLFVFLAENLHVFTEGLEEGNIVTNARRYGNILTELIKEGQDNGELNTEVDARAAMLGIVGMCNWSHRWYRDDGAMTLSEFGRQFSILILQGLAPRRAKPKRAKA